MLKFSALRYLDRHQKFVQSRMKMDDVFLVWWCVRDLLLWLTKDPLDIDFTCAWTPQELYECVNTEWLSFFKTDKFWTLTLIPPKEKERSYQLTPLRTEWDYWDFRHPWEIHRSNDILLDVKRRDFSINAMYYFSVKQKIKRNLDYKKENPVQISDEDLIQILSKNGYCYLADINLFIVVDPQFIWQIFFQAKFDEYAFRYLVETQEKCYILSDNKWNTLEEKNEWLFRVLIDPEWGVKSLVSKKLTTVWEADLRFGEDALRLIRGLRIVNICNHKMLQHEKKYEKTLKKSKSLKNINVPSKAQLFDFSSETWDSIKRNSHLLWYVAKERIKEELCKVFQKWNPFGFIVLLEAAGMLPILFPALAKTKFVDQPIRYHAFDVYTHTMLALKAVQEINDNYLVRFAMLYHDVWKVWQYSAYEKAKTKEERQTVFSWPLNHRESSPVLMKTDFMALWFSKKEIDVIEWLIHEHHTPWEILNSNPNNWTKKIRKLLSEKWFDMLDSLFDINIADRIGQENPLQNSSDLSDSYYLKVLLRQINDQEWQFEKKDMVVNWEKIMKHFQLSPSPIVWELINHAFDWVLWNIKERNIEREIYVFLENYLRNRKDKK